MALKCWVWPYRYYQVKVAAGAAIAGLSLASDAYPGAIINPGRDFHLKAFYLGHYPGAATDLAGQVLNQSAALTDSAGFLNLKTDGAAGAVIGFLKRYLNR